MNLIQYILILLIAYFISRLVVKLKKKEIHSQDFILWLIFWGVGIYVVIYPEVTQEIADFVGIGRGVDLVIYLAVLSLFYVVFKSLVKHNELEEQITKLGREIALSNAIDNTKKNKNESGTDQKPR